MSSTQIILIGVLVIISIWILCGLWIRLRARKIVSDITKRVFPVWAAQGPFENGVQSASGMRYAYLAVLGPEETKRMAETITMHAKIYDEDPAAWEQLRKAAEQQADSKTEGYVTVAKAFAAMPSLNEDIVVLKAYQESNKAAFKIVRGE